MISLLKKVSHVLITLTLILFLLPFSTNVKAASVSAEQLIFIAVNDGLVEFTDAKPVVEAGVTYVPLRSLAALLNAEVRYDGTENSVTVTKDSRSMKILINENMYQLESTDKFPLTIKTVQNRTLLPLRFIAEYLQMGLTFYGPGPIARLIDKNAAIQYTDEQLYMMYKDKIENEKQQWTAAHEEPESAQIAYLTFDDGPNANTAAILDTLKKYNAHATFFMVEPKTRNNKEAVLRMVAEKHAIASHSVSHDKTKVYQSPEALLNEMNKTRETLYAITGIDSRLIRVPYGSKPYLTEDFRNILANNNFQLWDWNVDSNDWRYSSEEIVSTVKKQVVNLKKKNVTPVILFHNGTNTVEILPEIIEFLTSEGYTLKAHEENSHFMMNFWDDERL